MSQTPNQNTKPKKLETVNLLGGVYYYTNVSNIKGTRFKSVLIHNNTIDFVNHTDVGMYNSTICL